MRNSRARLQLATSIGCLLAVASVTPAVAADWNSGAGGIKDYGSGAVAVPAPHPVPVYKPAWYFRADAGMGLGDATSGSESGTLFGRDADTTPAFGYQDDWKTEDFDNHATLGVGVGGYWSNGWRGDLTAEYRTEGNVKFVGRSEYETDNEDVRVTVGDHTSYRSGLFMANAYRDLTSYGRFTPYLGAGAGIAWSKLSRTHSSSEARCAHPCLSNSSYRTARTDRDTADESVMRFAAMATAGATYRYSDTVALDFNYRFLYVDGADVSLNGHGGQVSRVSIDETFDHQLRAGLRFDIH